MEAVGADTDFYPGIMKGAEAGGPTQKKLVGGRLGGICSI